MCADTFKRDLSTKGTWTLWHGRALEVCLNQLADVFKDMFKLSLLQSVVPTYFKKTTSVPAHQLRPKLNHYNPVALTSNIMKRFLVQIWISSFITDSLAPLQFSYQAKHVNVRMLLIDYSSAVNTNVPSKLVIKTQRPRSQQRPLWLDPELCDPRLCV